MFRIARRIAAVAHEANRGYCAAIGDPVPPAWVFAPSWMTRAALVGVDAALRSPSCTPADSHAAWMETKRAEGCIYVAEKCSKSRTHPCMRPYEDLPARQRVKDYIFLSIVRALSQEIPDALPPMEPESARYPEDMGGASEAEAVALAQHGAALAVAALARAAGDTAPDVGE